ncbi:basic amino acid ABC transporter substrate-binding protein [Tumebacillus permanentifrigoris]|uniref:Amino acid ABC transporter substrate-binding protein (PAAT family) n=1 Tax=Tumebacillus permanentifrigoris TaxID=378543 RepID=A0A316D3Z8_9BACL|nr:basic amino acid ABC transporter substrate-binding protein [Tumebacillus permanentifrigoris]PWK05713.1 amino acid ABC transporter substrate-binding protein (PAAT family) [Tumebacillus permanentifrigoris]
MMKKNWKTLMLTGTMILGMGLFTAGCGSSTTSSTTNSAEKEYVVGTDASYAPFEAMNSEKIEGFDIDVLSAAAEAGGFKVTFKNTPWDGIFLTLKNGERDIVASAVTITDERKKEFDFSDPYFDATQMIVSKKGKEFKTLNDLKDKKIAVQNATTGDEVVSKLLGQDNPNIKRFENMPLALLELKNGGVDAAVGDNGVVLEYVKSNGNGDFVTAVDSGFATENYGFALKKGNTELQKKLNDGIKKIKDSGKLDEINKKYGFKK